MATQLSKDIKEVNNAFPKLNYFDKSEGIFFKGELDICDTKGNYWDTFTIGITIPKNYPFGVPLLFEISNIIPREDDRHIDKNGLCCVDIEHELLYLSRQGIRIIDFIRDKVYPFFANQLYFKEEGKYSNGEYKHRFEGIVQFYNERLNITDNKEAIKILQTLLEGKNHSRNELCFCGSEKKLKHCHLESVIFLKTLGNKCLIRDLEEFEKIG
jgi:hypothetical protein